MHKFMRLHSLGLLTFNKPAEGGAGGAGSEGNKSPWEELFGDMKPEDVKKALDNSRKWEDRAKENKDAAAELAILKAEKDASKTEIEKLTETVNQLSAERAKDKAEKQIAAWAADIVKDSKIPASALRGQTEEELREHFEILKNALGEQAEAKKGATAPYVPSEGGAGNGHDPKEPATRPGIGTLRDAYAESDNK